MLSPVRFHQTGLAAVSINGLNLFHVEHGSGLTHKNILTRSIMIVTQILLKFFANCKKIKDFLFLILVVII